MGSKPDPFVKRTLLCLIQAKAKLKVSLPNTSPELTAMMNVAYHYLFLIDM